MQNPVDFYKRQIDIYKVKSAQLFKTLSLLSLLRLGVFFLTVFGIYKTYNTWQIALVIATVGIGLFLFLLSKYTDLKTQRQLYKRLVTINEEELKITSGDFLHRPDGGEFTNPKHYYSLDIDLFGKGSFFQYCNRTTLKTGTQKLADAFLANNIENIVQRQNAIKELAGKPNWRQHYTAMSQGIVVEHSTLDIVNWLKNYQPFLSKIHYSLSIVFSVASLVIIGLSIVKIIPLAFMGYWLLLGLLLTGFYVKKVTLLAQNASKAKDTFRQYALLLKAIEEENFQSQLLQHHQNIIKTKAFKASKIVAIFSKVLDALDNRNNIISAVFGNGYLLWDIRQTYHIEQWIKQYTNNVETWFNVVAFFDAYNSLGNYAYNHQEFSYPEITNTSTTISAQQLGHPLLNINKRVNSDLHLQHQQFFIVTGANMAGKSTFLRTVALHIVMANMGLPVCAHNSSYKPIKLITSMRTTDSLTDDSSYFFSELTRLKFVVDTIKNDSNYFVILDEILKGTNSTDKAIGSQKFVERLVTLKATGIIATHDISLTKIENNLAEVNNYYFDAEIIDNELHFDYKLKQGVCHNMNASFLLKKMAIVDV